MRNTYKKVISDICKKNSNIILVLVDSGDREYDELRELYSDRIVECGISEQNAIGVAAGIAGEGMIPVIYGMSPFLIYRACEFIRDDVCLQNLNVKIMGTGAGIIYNNLGPTHHATEDIGILRTFPNMRILSPASPKELMPCIESAINEFGPTYVRMGKAWEEEIYVDMTESIVSKCVVLNEGEDVCIISTGSITATALKAASILAKEGISAKVVNVRQLKPIDEANVFAEINGFKKIVTIEEHNVLNGLGSIISDVITKEGKDVCVMKIGFDDVFCKDYGWYQDIKKLNGLEENDIANKILNYM